MAQFEIDSALNDYKRNLIKRLERYTALQEILDTRMKQVYKELEAVAEYLTVEERIEVVRCAYSIKDSAEKLKLVK